MAAMTRQEMADALEPISDGIPDGPDDVAVVRISACRAAAAELHKTCAGCRHFEAATGNDYEMPVIVCQ
jgi:hypothetical protein